MTHQSYLQSYLTRRLTDVALAYMTNHPDMTVSGMIAAMMDAANEVQMRTTVSAGEVS